jgi:hypothetical protein
MPFACVRKLFYCLCVPAIGAAGTFPDVLMAPTQGWAGPVFHLSQQYPNTPGNEPQPWKQFDFRTQPNEYLKAVLAYCLQGNIEADWDIRQNSVRRWYHAPWLHWGRNGREFIHGLTHERISMPGELAATQTSQFQNWAVGMYNQPGGYTIGKVWQNPLSPNINAAVFPEGTVSFKLLFTQATRNQVPYLAGSKEWQAYIYSRINIPTNPRENRIVETLRLLQVDIAIKDSRAKETGWVFGTFTYNGTLPGQNGWAKLVPIGLMWGNDPGVTVAMVRQGYLLRESRIYRNTAVPRQHLGWAGRLNGPVDNPISSCLSCHSTAQWPAVAPAIPTNAQPGSPGWLNWFRNIGPGQAFSAGSKSLDYSMQLAVGIGNFSEWRELQASMGGFKTDGSGPNLLSTSPSGSRRTFQLSRDADQVRQ